MRRRPIALGWTERDSMGSLFGAVRRIINLDFSLTVLSSSSSASQSLSSSILLLSSRWKDAAMKGVEGGSEGRIGSRDLRLGQYILLRVIGG